MSNQGEEPMVTGHQVIFMQQNLSRAQLTGLEGTSLYSMN